MATDIFVVRDRARLAPADPVSADEIAKIKANETIIVTYRRPRNGRHHNKFFALLKVVFESQNTFSTQKKLLNAIKIATGHFEMGETVDGVSYPVPKSISFASMCQSEFEQFYDKAVSVILTKILPNTQIADLERRVLEILQGN